MRTSKALFIILALALANCTKVESDKGPLPPVFHDASQCPSSASVALKIQQNDDDSISIISDIGPRQDLLIDGQEHTVFDANDEMPKIYRGGCHDGVFTAYYRVGSKLGVLALTKTADDYVLTDEVEGQPSAAPKHFKKVTP